MTANDLILQSITPVTHDLGDFKVHRSLPARERTMVGPFIFFDQAGPARIGPAGAVLLISGRDSRDTVSPNPGIVRAGARPYPGARARVRSDR